MRYLLNYLIYVAVVVRAIGWNQETAPIPAVIWILLAIFGVVLFSQQALTRLYPSYPRIYIFIQSVSVISMFYLAPTVDFLTMLFIPLFFQTVQFLPGWLGFTWIVVQILAMAGRLLFGLEWEAGLTMLLTGSLISFLMGSFAYLINRTDKRQLENQRLYADLQGAYRTLKDSAAQAEALAAATERHHLVRELHDTLTQTLFSMNLAGQSAQLALAGTPGEAEEHLVRLQTLARSAAREVQELTEQVTRYVPAHGGLVAALQKLADDRLVYDGLHVDLEVTGQRALPGAVEADLFRITQEALNNITRHAGVDRAVVRLHLESPSARLEIEDEGCGFDYPGSMHTGGFGLAGMVERASEIGWDLHISSQPGRGTRVIVAEKPQ